MGRNYFRGSLVAVMAIIIIAAGCGNRRGEPTILTLWHNYGGQLEGAMDEMINEFNETVGAEEGIIINVTSISGSASIHEKLIMAANEEPGAPFLPDLCVAYPKTAMALAEKGLLADLDQLFTSDELSAYIPDFLQEGRLLDGGLYIFPTAKSTEVLFVNKTLFDRFAGETGVRLDDLQTFEGIGKTAALYYDWTDQQTPGVEHDGKMFFMADSLFNYALVGCQQLGIEFIGSGTCNLASPEYFKVWESYFKPALLGHFAVYDGYASELAKTGEIVCSTGSTAGIMFFSPVVTHADNTTEPARMLILPYPVFEGGEKVALQRGAGMCVLRSTGEKERQAAVFLKWFTSPENNLRFVASTGYLPVTVAAFEQIMCRGIEEIPDENIKNLLLTCKTMKSKYRYCTPPLYEGADQLPKRYESRYKELAADAVKSWREQEGTCEALLARFYRQFAGEFQ